MMSSRAAKVQNVATGHKPSSHVSLGHVAFKSEAENGPENSAVKLESLKNEP
jgi:hypothetical protein